MPIPNKTKPDTPIQQLKNLGPTSAKQLSRININNFSELGSKGAIECFIELSELDNFKPSLNFLYAMLGAIEGKHWTQYKNIKGQLLLELEDNIELRKLFI